MNEEWYLWRESAPHSPYYNMAIDEVLLGTASEIGKPLVRIYSWDRPAMSIGSSQTYPTDVDPKYAVVRRPTGGGNVYHDIDVTYSVIIPPGHAIAMLDRLSSYRVFHESMVPVFSRMEHRAKLQLTDTPDDTDRATMKCFTSPSKFDVLADDGSKLAGAAQRRTRDGILHQGSVLLAATGGDRLRLVEALLKAFTRSFEVCFLPYTPPESVVRSAERLAAEKYRSRSWNYESRYC